MSQKDIQKKILLAIFLLFSLYKAISAQELQCNVILNDQQVQTQERQVITQLRDAITQFLNTTQWTNVPYKQHERIKCNVLVTLTGGTDVAAGRYTANVQIQSSRPVFASNYETTLLTFFDRNFAFEFFPSQPLIFTENVFTTNLTSILAYYAYTILAMDADSFASLGGNVHIERMLNILNITQQSGAAGWGNTDTRNRFWISENLNNPQMKSFREANYLYHRRGLDLMASKPDEARKNILEALKKIRESSQSNPTAVMINAFFDSKSEEIFNILQKADPNIKKEAVDVLLQLDPPNGQRYKQLLR